MNDVGHRLAWLLINAALIAFLFAALILLKYFDAGPDIHYLAGIFVGWLVSTGFIVNDRTLFGPPNK